MPTLVRLREVRSHSSFRSFSSYFVILSFLISTFSCYTYFSYQRNCRMSRGLCANANWKLRIYRHVLYCRSNGNCYDEFDVQRESDVWKSCFALKNVDKSPVVNKSWPPHRRCGNFLYDDANESTPMPLLNIFSNSRSPNSSILA